MQQTSGKANPLVCSLLTACLLKNNTMALYDLKNPYDRQRFKEAANRLVLDGAYVEMKKKNTQRTLAENAYLHVLLGYFASQYGCSMEEVKIDFYKRTCNKDLFIRTRRNNKGVEIKYLRSSASLDKREMSLSIERFRNWASAECGIYLPEPNEGEALFYAQQQIENYKEFI